MNFTRVIIECELCIDDNFSNKKNIEKCIDGLYEVLQSPYNSSNMEQDEQQSTLMKFVVQSLKMDLPLDAKKKRNFIQNKFIVGKG